MVNLFGDWWADATVMFIIFILFIFFWLFYVKDKESLNKMGTWVAVIIFVISAFEVLGRVFGDTNFSGPPEGFVISAFVMLFSGIGLLIGLTEIFSDKK
ncbi:MAG: hypothetical protein WCI04_04125 [archaeon]